jgi:hypothetical protein
MTPQTTRDDFECIFVDGILLERKKRKKKNHAGSKTLPASCPVMALKTLSG